MGKRQNAGTCADLRIAHNAVSTDRHTVSERDVTFNHHIDVDANIATAFKTAADIEPRAIAHQHATRHQLIGQRALMLALKLLKLLWCVHTLSIKIVIGTDYCYRHVILPGQPEHIGQIVL